MSEKPTDKPTQEAPVAGAGASEAKTDPPPQPRAPFHLAKGARIRLNHRTGTVLDVRGASAPPYEAYDVKILWDGERYAEWHLYATLKRHYEQGHLEILSPGKPSLFDRIYKLFTGGRKAA